MKKIITRKYLYDRISDLIEKKVSASDFGEEMFSYFAFDDIYKYEPGYEELIQMVLDEFTEMHDLGKKDIGYTPSVPSLDKLNKLKEILASEGTKGQISIK